MTNTNINKDNCFEYNMSEELIKVHKLIAKRGYCSTRKAEELIKKGVVKANNELAHVGQLVPFNSSISINSEKIPDSIVDDVYIIHHKRKGVECSKVIQTKGLISVFDEVPKHPSLHYVGRLDAQTTGLLVLTTNGNVVNQIIHPSSNINKTYEVELDKQLHESDKVALVKQGVILDNSISFMVSIKNIKSKSYNYKYRIVIKEGKKHIIKRMFQAKGYRVINLKRVALGNLILDELKLPIGSYMYMSHNELLNSIFNV